MDDNELIESIDRRMSKSESEKLDWKTLNDQAYGYTQPNRNMFDDIKEVGAKKNIQVYDSTAVLAVRSFVSMIENALNPQDSSWFLLEPNESVPQQVQEQTKAPLQKVTEILMSYINKSNFYLASYESAFDLSVGTAAIMVSDGTEDNPLNFQSVPISQIYPEENSYGVIDTVFRKFDRVKKRDISRLWPNATFSSEFERFLNSAKDEQNLEFIEGTIALEQDLKSDSEQKYRYVVIHKGTNSVLINKESDSTPWVVYRWGKLALETFGRGPVINVLPTIQTLNKMVEYEMRAAAFKALPPFMGFADDVFNPWTARIEPNAIIPINRSSMGEAPLKALDIPSNIQFSQLLANDLRQQINDMLFVNPIGRVDAPVRTATEVQVRQKIALEVMGPAFTRLQVEKLTPLISRCIYLLQRRGLLPNFVVNGKMVKAIYQSPLAESRKIDKITGFNNMYTNLQQIFGPQMAIGTVKATQIPEYLATQYNADLDLINTSEQITQTIQSAQQAQQQQPQPVQGQEPAPAFQPPPG